MKIGVMYVAVCVLLLVGCKSERLSTVTVEQFAMFVQETGYVTDAERFQWSFVQVTVDSFKVEKNVNWRNAYPEGVVSEDYPVVQVSYNDAVAYAKWSKTSLPDYDKYWQLVKNEGGVINSGTTKILPANQCNVVGNVWEITTSRKNGEVRLAGGSYLCNENTCNGTSPDRELYVDPFTGNSHISFVVVKR